ncbi:MAG: hypothetical protein F6K17_42825, partial [Okeania sp. SIO3C4]|nr:hypothetical protein [Okeania sp. SIO3C4]
MKKNNTSITGTGSIKKTTMETGSIRSPKDAPSKDNNTSINSNSISRNASDVYDSNLKTGDIDETLEKYQLEA